VTLSLVSRAPDSIHNWLLLFLVKFRQPLLSSSLIGLFGFLVSWTASWTPSPWLDEAATAHIISYPISDMARLWERTDAVYAPYYVFMHFWIKVVGVTPFTLRLPSLLAVGVGTAAMAITGRTVGGPRAQLLYGLCFALLPRTTAMGIEARPYAMSSMFMALALTAVVKLRLMPSVSKWLLLGVAMVGAVASQFFSALPIVGMVLAAIVQFSARSRVLLIVTSGLSALVCLPLAKVAVSQQNQVSWIGDEAYSLANQALVESWFTSRWSLNPAEGTNVQDLAAVILSVVAGLTVVTALACSRNWPASRLALAATPPLIAILVLWSVSLVDSPVLLGRYLTSSAPFVAMFLAECIMLLRPKAKTVFLPLLLLGSVMVIVGQREPYAKIPANDYAFIASTLQSRADRGDGLLIEPGLGPVDSARNALDLYPKDFSRLVDIARPQREPLSFVFATDPAIADISQSNLPPRIWVVKKNGQISNYEEQLAKRGYIRELPSAGPAHAVSSWYRR